MYDVYLYNVVNGDCRRIMSQVPKSEIEKVRQEYGETGTKNGYKVIILGPGA